ncbi:MAG: T9SS type A sorting domain-containing protein, partial [Rhodothermales bacterium]
GNLSFDVATVEKNAGWGITTSGGNIAFKVVDFLSSIIQQNGLGGIRANSGSLTGSRITVDDNGAASTTADGHGVTAKTINVRGLTASDNKGDGIRADEVKITLDPSGGAIASRNGGYGIYAKGNIFAGRVTARKNGKWGVYTESGSVTGPVGPGANIVDDNPLGGISARQGTVSGDVYAANDNGSGATGDLEGHGIIAKKIDVRSSSADGNAGHGFTAETINHREYFPSDALNARRNGKDGVHATGDITADRIITDDNGGWGAFSESGTYRTRSKRWHDFHSGNGLGGIGAPNGFVSAEAAYISQNGASSTSTADGYGVLAKYVALQRAGVHSSFRDGVVGETVVFKNSLVEDSGGYGIVVKGGGLTVRGSIIRNNRLGGILHGAAGSEAVLAGTSKSAAESSAISYSDISANEGIGLAVETDDPVDVSNSNLFGNAGSAIENSGAGSVMAVDNWWGDASGPGPSVVGDVATDPWLEDDIGVVAFAYEEEHIASAGAADSMFIAVNNFADRTGEVDISKNDSLGWLVTDEVITIQLSDTLTTTYLAEYSIPADLEDGTENVIHVRVVSKSDPTNEATATYRVVIGTPVGVERDEPTELPGAGEDPPAVLEVYPNPVQASATVHITLNEEGRLPVTLRLYDALGRSLGTRFSRLLTAGTHVISVPVDGLPAGIYFIRMDAEGKVEVTSMIVSH